MIGWNVFEGRIVCLVMDTALDRAGQQLIEVEFEAFYRNRWDEIYRTLAVTLRDPDLASEAVDEAMTRAFERWRKVQVSVNPAGWVYRVAVNWAIDQLRHHRRRSVKGVAQRSSWEPAVPDPEITHALDRLSVEQRAVVVLRVVHDWSEQDVAYALNIPVGTVKSRLSRSIERLREELNHGH